MVGARLMIRDSHLGSARPAQNPHSIEGDPAGSTPASLGPLMDRLWEH